MTEPYRGFDELKRHHPTAQYVELEFPWRTPPIALLAQLGPYMNRINADEFRGYAPKTLLLVGPKADDARPTAALGFVHRPEGWNTAIDPETGLRDEIIDAQTGRPLLEAADFDALASVIDGNG